MKTKAATFLILSIVFVMPIVADDVDKWIQDLKDPSPSVRQAAAEALGDLGSARAIGPLIQALSDSDSGVRGYAVYALGKLNDTRAVDPLILALGDTASHVRNYAAWSLGEIGDIRAVSPLIKTLSDNDSDLRASAAKSLGDLKDPRAVNPLILALGDISSDVRSKAAKSLGDLKDPRAVNPLILALGDISSDVRSKAAEALGKLRDTRAVSPLILSLKDEDLVVRWMAAEALGDLGDTRAVEPLIQALRDEDMIVRRCAASGLGRLNDTRAVEPLKLALNDKSEFVQRAAAAALEMLNPAEEKKGGTALGQGDNSQDTSEYQKSIILNGQVATGDFTWNPQNFAGFYYDLDNNVGTEELTTTLTDGQLSGSEPFGLAYQTTAQKMPFRFKSWGSYSVIGFLGRKCLAGYLESINPDENLFFGKSKDGNSLAKGQLEEVLLDDDAWTVITTNSPLILKNGYKLALKALNATDGRIYVELTKEGKVVHSKMFQLKDDASIFDQTFYYKTDVEAQKGLVVIAVHFKNAFHASDQNIAIIDGIFQISESPILVAKGTSFGKMKISSITSDQILMDNQGSTIKLSKNKDVLLAWPSLHLRTADQSVVGDASPLRYCLYREIDSPGKYDVRGSVSTGDYTWTPQNFAGFHYDLDDDVGTETLTATLSNNKLSGDVYPYGLVYETTAQQKPFKFKDWGSYYVMGFLGEKCFAGYMEGSDSDECYLFDKSTDRSALAKGQLLKVLADDDSEKTITSNSSLKLEEGYELALKPIDVDSNKALIELSKNGTVVDRKELQPSKDAATMADQTYCYRNPQVGSQKNLVTIAVHFKNAFRGAGLSLATIDGIWQISDSPIEVKPGAKYGEMTIATVDAASGVITMDNKNYSITLSKHKYILLMGSIYLQTANSDSLRYYIVKHQEIKD